MALPLFKSPASISNPDDKNGWKTSLPAVAVTANSGFLVECAPVARFGTRREFKVMVLLSHEQRHDLYRCVSALDGLLHLAEVTCGELVLLRPDDSRGSWHNGENLWVSVPWLASLEEPEDISFRQRMLFDLIRAAQKLA